MWFVKKKFFKIDVFVNILMLGYMYVLNFMFYFDIFIFFFCFKGFVGFRCLLEMGYG